jgi:hypothetical protein
MPDAEAGERTDATVDELAGEQDRSMCSQRKSEGSEPVVESTKMLWDVKGGSHDDHAVLQVRKMHAGNVCA